MSLKNITIILVVISSLLSCKSPIDQFNSNYSLSISSTDKSYNNGSELNISIVDDATMGIDSVVWMENARIIDGENGITLSRKLTENSPLGKVTYEAHIYKNGVYAIATSDITRYSKKKPKGYSYEIVNTFPHLTESYTQGLEFYGDSLYESTGQFKESDIRITNVITGEAMLKKELEDYVFAEGMTIINDKVIQLTWQNDYGIVYDLGLNKIDEFRYGRSKEGWGLTNDGQYIYKSDGSSKIWKINPETYEEEGYIMVTSTNKTFDKINELEFIDGMIYANQYQNDAIMIINPKNGALEAVIDTRTLKDKVTNNDKDKDNNVLNGIAYNKTTGNLFVTGKRWEKMFEIKVIK